MMEEQEKKLSRFSRLAAWTEYELADLCLGLTPDRGRADNEERNEVLEFIHRAAEMGELPRMTNSLQPLSLNQYRTSTYYPRSDATRWAAANFPKTFLFMPESGGTTGQEEKPRYSTPRLNTAGGYPVVPEGLQIGGGEDKPLGKRERDTLLTIIAAFCKYESWDVPRRRTATEIAQLTDDLGAPVTDDTIRKILAQIPQAVESRMK